MPNPAERIVAIEKQMQAALTLTANLGHRLDAIMTLLATLAVEVAPDPNHPWVPRVSADRRKK